MELELVAGADTVAGLSRLKTLGASRNGRPRAQSIKIVWHDSPEHALLADGVTLAEQRGARRLERLLPGSATWLPAQPVPVVVEVPDETALPTPLAPLAAFEGRQTTSVHQFADQPVVVTVIKGVIRSVTAEQPAARIWLSGEEEAVRAAAILIAGTIPAAVPVTCLAAEAIALATGRPATPRQEGAPALPAEQLSVTDALTHILGHLIDVMLANAPVAAKLGGDGVEAVHQMRVAVRRTRSAASIFRPALPQGALDGITGNLKELGSKLGPTRDWDVFSEETLPGILQALPDEERLQRLVAAASRRRRECQKALAAYLDSTEFRILGIELAWFAAARFWHVTAEAPPGEEPDPPPLLADFAGQVLQQRWKKLVSAAKRIEELDIPSLHAVRLRAKRTRYAAEMFSTLHQGKATQRFIRRLSALQQRLGVMNDGAVATHLLSELGGQAGRHAYATGIVIGYLAARGARIRPRIVQAFERFRRQPVFWA